MGAKNLEKEKKPSEERAHVLPQVMTAIAAAMGQLVAGTGYGWSATALPSLIEDPDLQVGTKESSLIVSMIGYGSLTATLVVGQILDRFGRRRTLLLVAPIAITGWLSMALAPSVNFVFFGRFLCGCASSSIILGTQLLSSETPEARLRGRLASLPSLFITIGSLITFGIGAVLPWRTGCFVVMAMPVLFFCSMLIVPESPYWLLLKGRDAEAAEVMRRLRGPHYDFEPEVKEMKRKIASVGNKAKISELLKSRTRRPFLIALLMHSLQQFGGANVIVMYAGTLLMKSGTSLDPRTAVVYMGLVQLGMTFIAVVLMDKLGRKVLILVSVLLVSVCMTGLATYFYVLSIGWMWPEWVPVVLILGVACSYCLGSRSVPMVLSTELFNTTIRSMASAICIFYNRIIYLLTAQTFPFLEEAAGIYTPLYIFGALGFVGAVITFICAPETKGKSLEEIQEYFEGLKNKKTPKQELKPSVNPVFTQETV